MAYYLMLFVAGFAGSFHCIGMCGEFACALGGDPHSHTATVLRHLLYNAGRLTSYCFLGGLAGAGRHARLVQPHDLLPAASAKRLSRFGATMSPPS